MGTFVSGDTANFHIVNVGASGFETAASQETVAGPTSFPVTPPQIRAYGDCVRRGVLYRFMITLLELEGSGWVMGQGKYVMPELKARVLQPAGGGSPWRLDRVS